jgi:hypothetical protein
MNGYLLDTNIVTAHRKKNPLVGERIRDYETKRRLLAVSARRQLAAFERLWRGLGYVSEVTYGSAEPAAQLSLRLQRT